MRRHLWLLSAVLVPRRTCAIAYDDLADAILGRGFRPFANYNATVPPSFWYRSNFETYHRDLATILVNHTGAGGWILEVGSFIGNSALAWSRAAARLNFDGLPVVCMDTWLGAADMWKRKGLALGPARGPTGEPRLFDQFLANVGSNIKGRTHVLPLRAPAMVGLRYLHQLVREEKIPRPRVIYLDTAHDYPETQIEMQAAWRLLAPGGIITGDDYDKYWPAVQQSVNEYAARIDPRQVAHPSTWATTWPGRRRMHHVELVAEPEGRPENRQHTMLPLVVRSPKQWLMKKAEPQSAADSSTASAPWPNGIATAMRCCLAGWADPQWHGLGAGWCTSARRRRALCEESAKRTAWYTQCRARGDATLQPSCHGENGRSCPVQYACRTPVYSVNGTLSSSPTELLPVKMFSR